VKTRAACATRASDPELLGGVFGYGLARLLVSRRRMFMSRCRVLMGSLRVLVAFLVIALFMVICCGVMRLGGVFVMLGCLAVCFVCHKFPLFPG
jgi:hypothetical protein